MKDVTSLILATVLCITLGSCHQEEKLKHNVHHDEASGFTIISDTIDIEMDKYAYPVCGLTLEKAHRTLHLFQAISMMTKCTSWQGHPVLLYYEEDYYERKKSHEKNVEDTLPKMVEQYLAQSPDSDYYWHKNDLTYNIYRNNLVIF